MATTDLGKWMITNGGEYNPNTTYEQLTMVLYQNSTYITLRTVTGIIPNNDKINYILMAQGFSANALADVIARDTYGAIGNVGRDVSAQNLVDYITNEVVNNLVKKTSISTVQTNSKTTVPSSSLAYSMQRAITENTNKIATVNSNLANVSSTATTANNKVQLNGPIKIIAYAGDGSWSFQQQYGDGHILSLNINDTQIAYDYYDGKNWTRKWTK